MNIQKAIKLKRPLIYALCIIALLLLVSLSIYLFIFKRIVWRPIYDSETTKYIHQNSYKISEGRYISTGYIYEIVPVYDNIIIGTIPYENEVKLVFNKNQLGKINSISYEDTDYGKGASVFYDFMIKEDKGDLLKILKCTFGNKEECTMHVSVTKVYIYPNDYPFPTLSEKESDEFMMFNIDKYTVKDTKDRPDVLKCNDYMSQYISSRDSDLLTKIKDLKCGNHPQDILYANIVGSSDPFYQYVKEVSCSDYKEFKEKEMTAIFTPTVVRILSSMCNMSYDGTLNEEEYIDNVLYVPTNILYLLNNKDIPEYNERMKNIKKDLSVKIFTTFPSPSCSILDSCSLDLINLGAMVFNESK